MKKPKLNEIQLMVAQAYSTGNQDDNKARLRMMATILTCDRFGYSPSQISSLLYVDTIEVESMILTAQKKYQTSGKFRAKCDIVYDLLSLSDLEDVTTTDNFYTQEDEIRIKKACISAEIFMLRYGDGEPPVIDGVGYFKQ